MRVPGQNGFRKRIEVKNGKDAFLDGCRDIDSALQKDDVEPDDSRMEKSEDLDSAGASVGTPQEDWNPTVGIIGADRAED